jgi:hypothetical protein
MKAAKTPSVIEPFSFIGGGLYFVRGGDGFGVYTPLDTDKVLACQVVFVFCSGEIWSIDSFILQATINNGEKFIPNIEIQLARGLQVYADFLIRLGLSPPFAWEAGMEDTMGRALYSKDWSPIGPRKLCMQPQIIATGSYSPGELPRESLRPFFATLFDACGAEWPGAT